MRQVKEFNRLLTDRVNLNESRLEQLASSVDAVFNALKTDPGIGSWVKDKVPQGSWAHRTIIKPPPGTEFDADFLLRMTEVPEWHDRPKHYLDYLANLLREHGTYRKVPIEQKCRCVRLTYAGDFHLDIVPFVRMSDDSEWIVNGNDNKWEPTNPTGYTAWIRNKDDTAERNLRKVIRLLKYLRDFRGAFEGTRSIILTTVAGERVDTARMAADPGYYADMPTTLLHVVTDLNEWLQANPTRPSITDPSAPGATFDHRWTDTTYSTLRSDIRDYQQQMHAAYHEQNPARSTDLWQEVFGTGFDTPPPAKIGGPFGVPPAAPGRSGRAG